MTRIYLCGPMTGIKDFNFPLFNTEAKRLLALGYEVVNPAEIVNTSESTDWQYCMRRDIIQLMTCDTLAKLPGCWKSRGACIECDLSERLGITVVYAKKVINQRESKQ